MYRSPHLILHHHCCTNPIRDQNPDPNPDPNKLILNITKKRFFFVRRVVAREMTETKRPGKTSYTQV